MTTVFVEAPVPTPEEERAVRKDALQRLYEQEPGISPRLPLANLFAIEETIHETLAGKTSIPEQIQLFEGIVKQYPILNEFVKGEPLMAKLIHIARGEVNLAFMSHN